MSPELENLVKAVWEYFEAEPKERNWRKSTMDRLINDALAKRPSLSREELLAALQDKLKAYARSQRKPPAIPPKA